jgi:hypothetical protein
MNNNQVKASKTIYCDDPENAARWLVALLGADKGVLATVQPVFNGAWWVVTQELDVLVCPIGQRI